MNQFDKLKQGLYFQEFFYHLENEGIKDEIDIKYNIIETTNTPEYNSYGELDYEVSFVVEFQSIIIY